LSELPDGIPRARPAEPRDSAAAILVRRDEDGRDRVLLARRSRSTRFMPGHLSFPGGTIDAADRETADPFRAAASRELDEELGLQVEATEWIDAGDRITPPMFPVRFMNRFFVHRVEALRDEIAPMTDELDSARFELAETVLEAWERGECRVPPPVLPILRCLARHESASLEQLAEAIRQANQREERTPRIEFTPGTWMVPLSTATLPPATHTNVWFPGGRFFAIVDPGSDEPEELDRLAGVIERRCSDGDRLRMVLLTHHHQDHVDGVAQIATRLDVPVCAHEATLEPLRDRLGDLRTLTIADGETIDLAGITLRAHHTPGHAVGHMAFELVDRGLLLTGDLVSSVSTILIDPESGDMGDYLQSLERMKELGCKTLLPGHGTPLPGKTLERVLEHRRQRESKIRVQLGDAPLELDRIARQAYDDLPEMPLPLIRRQTLSHLLLLERSGSARRVGEDGDQWSTQ